MNICKNTPNYNTSFNRKLVPIANYKGPMLKLTAEDKAEIAKLTKNLEYLREELTRSIRFCVNRDSDKIKENRCNEAARHYEDRVNECIKNIENVKKRRLSIQKQEETSLLDIKG